MDPRCGPRLKVRHPARITIGKTSIPLWLLYTTNSMEALNHSVQRVIKTRTMFPHEESAKKLIYLALQRIMEKWKLPVRAWSEAMPVFTAMYGE